MPSDNLPAVQSDERPPVPISETMDAMGAQFAKVMSPGMVDRFKRVALTAIKRNPDLQQCDRASVMAACMLAAQQNLMPDGREGAIIARWNRREGRMEAVWQAMYQGIIALAKRSGGVLSISCEIVWRGERFRYLKGDEPKIQHAYDPEYVTDDPNDVVAVYAIATLANGEKEREVMTGRQIESIRKLAKSDQVWSKHFGEMARKTVIHRLGKRLPTMGTDEDDRLRAAIESVEAEYEFRRERERQKDQPPAAVPQIEGRADDATEAEQEIAREREVSGDDPDRLSDAVVYVATNGERYAHADVEEWRGAWLKRIRALAGDGDAAALKAALERNRRAIAAVSEVAPLTADSVLERINGAIAEMEKAPEGDGEGGDDASSDGEAARWDWPSGQRAQAEEQAGSGATEGAEAAHPMRVAPPENPKDEAAWNTFRSGMKKALQACRHIEDLKTLGEVNKPALDLLCRYHPTIRSGWDRKVGERGMQFDHDGEPERAHDGMGENH